MWEVIPVGKSEGCGEQERRETQFKTHHQFYHCWWWLVSGLTRTFSGALWNASQNCLPGRTNRKHYFTGSCPPWVQVDFLTLSSWYFWVVMKYQGVACCIRVWQPAPRRPQWLLLLFPQLWAVPVCSSTCGHSTTYLPSVWCTYQILGDSSAALQEVTPYQVASVNLWWASLLLSWVQMLPDDGASAETSGSDTIHHLHIITSHLPPGVGSGNLLRQKGTFCGELIPLYGCNHSI